MGSDKPTWRDPPNKHPGKRGWRNTSAAYQCLRLLAHAQLPRDLVSKHGFLRNRSMAHGIRHNHRARAAGQPRILDPKPKTVRVSSHTPLRLFEAARGKSPKAKALTPALPEPRMPERHDESPRVRPGSPALHTALGPQTQKPSQP